MSYILDPIWTHNLVDERRRSKTPPGGQVFLPNFAPWITSFLSLTFSTNVLCTSSLSYRILRI
ncbi:hypothetical protein DFH09DRAFT_1330859 [Mycena vulgaris]|nr:hypothetical protein DFH09DRAFT_1330859 [Mycena vulgaris]